MTTHTVKKMTTGTIRKAVILLTAAVLVVLTPAGCSSKTAGTPSQQSQQVLRVGAIPAEDAQKTRTAYQALMTYLEQKTGLKTDLFVATDYTGVIEAMRSGKLDIAYFGPLSYVLASQQANAEAFAVENQKDTGTAYHAVIVTHPGSGIKTLEDLKGHTFAFVDPASTSGNLIPRAQFKSMGIDPDKEFKSVVYAGGHDAVEYAIKNKKVEAGADDDTTYNMMIKNGDITKDDSVVIWTSDPIPGSPWAWRKDLPDDLKTKIKDAFLNLAKENPAALQSAAGTVVSYEPIDDSAYAYIKQVNDTMNAGK